MSAVDQLGLVQKYYQTSILKNKTFKQIEDYGVATFAPAFVGKNANTAIYKFGSVGYKLNSSLDANGDSTISVGEIGEKYAKRYVK